MEDNKNIQLNIENLPRLENGSLDLALIAIGKDEKNNYIVPDEVMTNYYSELPNGTINESGTFTAYNKGLLKALDNETRVKGGKALQAELKQRRTFKEIVEKVNNLKVPEYIRQVSEDRGIPIPEGLTIQEAIVYANSMEAIIGSGTNKVKAAEFNRDTSGEKPSTEIIAEVNTTPEDMELVKRVKARLENANS